MMKLSLAAATVVTFSAAAFAGSPYQNAATRNQPIANTAGSGFTLPVTGSYVKFHSTHQGAGQTSGSVVNGNQGGTASFGGLSSAGTATNTVVARDAAGNPVYSEGKVVIIQNPAAGMVGVSGSEVAGTSYQNSANAAGLSHGNSNSSAGSHGSAEGMMGSLSFGSLSSLKR